MPKVTKTNQNEPKHTAPAALLEKTDKSTAAEIEQRVTKVFEMLVLGKNRRQIIAYAALEKGDKRDWNVSDRMIDEYMATAKGIIDEYSATKRDYAMSRSMARLDTLFASTMSVQDFQRALSANDQYNKLLGLYPPQQLQITHLFEKAGLTVELVTQLLDALESRNIAASDVFNTMLAELSREDATKS